MTTCKITEITPPVEPPAPADRTFTLTLTGQELQHLRASMGNQNIHEYQKVLGADMGDFFARIDTACYKAGIPRLSYPHGL